MTVKPGGDFFKIASGNIEVLKKSKLLAPSNLCATKKVPCLTLGTVKKTIITNDTGRTNPKKIIQV